MFIYKLKWNVIKIYECTRMSVNFWKIRMFGSYIESGWNGEFEYVKYEYKNFVYIIPTTSTGEH